MTSEVRAWSTGRGDLLFRVADGPARRDEYGAVLADQYHQYRVGSVHVIKEPYCLVAPSAPCDAVLTHGQHPLGIRYRATWSDPSDAGACDIDPCNVWRPGHMMPGWASRFMVRIKGVRQHRLSAITGADAVRAGFGVANYAGPRLLAELHAHAAFLREWRAYHRVTGATAPARRRASDVNQSKYVTADPWVWRIEFELLSGRVLARAG